MSWAVGVGAVGRMAVVVAMVVAVMLAVVVVSLGMILCIQIVGFSRFLKRHYGQTDRLTADGRMNGWTDPLIEMRRRI